MSTGTRRHAGLDMIARTGLSVPEHQRRTVASFLRLRDARVAALLRAAPRVREPCCRMLQERLERLELELPYDCPLEFIATRRAPSRR